MNPTLVGSRLTTFQNIFSGFLIPKYNRLINTKELLLYSLDLQQPDNFTKSEVQYKLKV
jgi:hypothetical protein